MSRFLSAAAIACSLALAGCTFELTGPEGAQAASPVACDSRPLACQGQILAESRCAQCHSIHMFGNSPYPGAQPFRVFWQRWTRPALATALKTGILAEHDQSDVKLPEMKLEEADIAAFFAYLDAIQEK